MASASLILIAALLRIQFAEGTTEDIYKGIHAGIKILDNFSRNPINLGEIIDNLPKYFEASGELVKLSSSSSGNRMIYKQCLDVFLIFTSTSRQYDGDVMYVLRMFKAMVGTDFIQDYNTIKNIFNNAVQYLNATVEMNNANFYKAHFQREIEMKGFSNATERMYKGLHLNEGEAIPKTISDFASMYKEVQQVKNAMKGLYLFMIQAAVTDAMYTTIKNNNDGMLQFQKFTWVARIERVVNTLRKLNVT